MFEEKHFTVDLATRTLPLVSRIVADIMERNEELLQVKERYTECTIQAEDPEQPDCAEEIFQLDEQQMLLMLQIHAYEKELNEIVGILRDAAHGEVDFLWMNDGREAHLCWLPGDENVAFWHEIDEDYTVRQPLPQMVLSGDDLV